MALTKKQVGTTFKFLIVFHWIMAILNLIGGALGLIAIYVAATRGGAQKSLPRL